MRWKLSRGKFRPRLQQLAGMFVLHSVHNIVRVSAKLSNITFLESNANTFVIDTSRRAFAMLKNETTKESNDDFYDLKQLRAAIKELSNLNGIGPATASLILAAFNQIVPFMADEALAATGLPLRYDISTYIKFAHCLQKRCLQLANLSNKSKYVTNSNEKITNKNAIQKSDTSANIASNNGSSFEEEEKKILEIDNSDVSDSLKAMEITPFVMSQCLWSFTISKKYGPNSIDIDNSAKNGENNKTRKRRENSGQLASNASEKNKEKVQKSANKPSTIPANATKNTKMSGKKRKTSKKGKSPNTNPTQTKSITSQQNPTPKEEDEEPQKKRRKLNSTQEH